ncbi:MAG: xanthine dehydrogenase family protein molybdopterin-binding subunit [Acetobacteraceae bacterium]
MSDRATTRPAAARAPDGGTVRSVMGDTPRRREDARFIIGQGRYLDDLRFDNLVHAVFVRSNHAHAVLRGIDTAAARAAPGVVAVLTAEDVAADGLNRLYPSVDANIQTGEPFRVLAQPLLAEGRVRYVGEPVALVVAATKHQALDAAELVAIDTDPLPVVTQADQAVAPGAPLLSDDVPNNTCMDWTWGQTGDVAAILKSAAHVVTIGINNHRIVTNPMEPRGAVAQYDPETGRGTLTVSTQGVHLNRDNTAKALGVDPKSLRFVAPDVGGGFGAKNFNYGEYALLLWAARRTGRTVKWIGTRSETFLADHQARDQLATATLALDADGRFLALHVDSLANLGAYIAGSAAGVQTFQYPHLQGTIYDIPRVSLRVRSVLTNTTPIGVTRGPGFGEANTIIERLIDAAAQQTGFDRLDLRRRNFYQQMPMTNALGFVVDSGDFRRHFDMAVDKADIAGFPARRAEAERRGRKRGLGIVCHIKGTGGLPTENVEIRFEADGGVTLLTGTQAIGQGHETTMPQIVADRLGIPDSLVTMKAGDTDLIAMGGGHGSSRATYMAGTAIHRASEIIINKGKPIAARALEAAEADIVFDNGAYRVAGTDRAITLLDVAALARDENDPLDTYHQWTREAMTFPNGTHVAEIEIDPETGVTTLERLTAVDDYGVMVNPMVASGQAHGAIAQGAGQALCEHAYYDPETGQPAASFMDYALPRADNLPSYDLSFSPTPCTTNPLGVKGCGEAGAVGLFPAIANAVADAVGVTRLDGPASPFRVWQAMRRRA